MATLGIRDQKADPVVKATIYGRPGDSFIRIVDVAIGCGLVERHITEPTTPPVVPIPMTAVEVFERRCAERAARESNT